jgi:hypothetical protein
MDARFDFHGLGVEVSGPETLVEDLRRDFSYFASGGARRPARAFGPGGQFSVDF